MYHLPDMLSRFALHDSSEIRPLLMAIGTSMKFYCSFGYSELGSFHVAGTSACIGLELAVYFRVIIKIIPITVSAVSNRLKYWRFPENNCVPG